jgi:hypothetical protein
MPLDRQGRKRALTAYERKQAEIEAAYLRQSVPVVVDDSGERPSCQLHGWSPPRWIEGQPRPFNATLCPECERERQEAAARRPMTVEVMPGPFRSPTPHEEDAWDRYKREHYDDLIRNGQVHLVDIELRDEACAAIDEARKIELADLKLTPEERFAKRRRRAVKYWNRRFSPRRDQVLITVEDEAGNALPGYEDPEDNWDRNADSRTWLARKMDEIRARRAWRRLAAERKAKQVEEDGDDGQSL